MKGTARSYGDLTGGAAGRSEDDRFGDRQRRVGGGQLTISGTGTDTEFDVPRRASALIAATVRLYRRYPLLFLVLAAGVIVPYELILLGAFGTDAHRSVGAGGAFALTLVDWVVIGPLVSALHVHAVADVKQGQVPEIAVVGRRGLRVLPVVAAATIMSGIGIFLGFLALIVPGIILTFRWAVVAQAAAIEHEGWLPALGRSYELTRKRYGHIFVFFVFVGLITAVPVVLAGLAFRGNEGSAGSYLVGLLLHVLTASFAALATALLFFDLRARLGPVDVPSSGEPRPPDTTSTDPNDYPDEDRPKGWYIDPDDPGRMRYWDSGGEPPGWSGTTRTPRKLRRAQRKNG